MGKSAAAFPEVELSAPYIAQQEYSSAQVQVLQINDNPAGSTLTAFCQLGPNESAKYWVPVLSGADYTVDWTNETVTLAIQAYFVNAPTA